MRFCPSSGLDRGSQYFHAVGQPGRKNAASYLFRAIQAQLLFGEMGNQRANMQLSLREKLTTDDGRRRDSSIRENILRIVQSQEATKIELARFDWLAVGF